MIPDSIMRRLQDLISDTINLAYEDAHTMLKEIISDAQTALDELIEENRDQE